MYERHERGPFHKCFALISSVPQNEVAISAFFGFKRHSPIGTALQSFYVNKRWGCILKEIGSVVRDLALPITVMNKIEVIEANISQSADNRNSASPLWNN